MAQNKHSLLRRNRIARKDGSEARPKPSRANIKCCSYMYSL